jgi:hypothetical protein
MRGKPGKPGRRDGPGWLRPALSQRHSRQKAQGRPQTTHANLIMTPVCPHESASLTDNSKKRGALAWTKGVLLDDGDNRARMEWRRWRRSLSSRRGRSWRGPSEWWRPRTGWPRRRAWPSLQLRGPGSLQVRSLGSGAGIPPAARAARRLRPAICAWRARHSTRRSPRAFRHGVG